MTSGNTPSKRGPAGKRRGLKKSGMQPVLPGDILVKQKGLVFHAGKNTIIGKDGTIHSKIEVGSKVLSS